MPAPALLPPVPLDMVPDLLRRRGVEVSRKRLGEAAAAGALPTTRRAGNHFVEEADLDAVEAYFRAHPGRPYRKAAAAGARAGKK